MCILASIFNFLLAAIPLGGVVNGNLHVNADFKDHNVNVGDPIEYSIEFYSDNDLSSLQTPLLAKGVDSKIWKVDDNDVKTSVSRHRNFRAVRYSKRFTYRVRPLKAGVQYFPRLAFSYKNQETGETKKVSSSEIPINAHKVDQVLSESQDQDGGGVIFPQPDGLIIDLISSPWHSAENLTQEELFQWEKACSIAKAEEFAKFDFPEARLNEAACAIIEGDWQKALKIYSSLEWHIGQTPTIERGIVAALALKTNNPNAELPSWRCVFRPILQYSWVGRLCWVLGIFVSALAIMFLLRCVLRLLVCVVFVCLFSYSVSAFDLFSGFREMEEEMQRMREQMQQQVQSMHSGGFSNVSINGANVKTPEIKVIASVNKSKLVVGENFDLLLSIETPSNCTLENPRIDVSRSVGLSLIGKSSNLTDQPGSTTNTVIKRILIPLRYDVPFKDNVVVSVNGMAGYRIEQRTASTTFSSFSGSSFSATSTPFEIEVKPIDGIEVPSDYKECIGNNFIANQSIDVNEVATNDVVVVKTSISTDGYIPDDAFDNIVERHRNGVIVKSFFVANGATTTPDISFSYYNPSKKKFEKFTVKGCSLSYVPPKDDNEKTPATEGKKQESKTFFIRFAPSESSVKIAQVLKSSKDWTIIETYGDWVRIQTPKNAGWVLKKEIE